MNATVVGLVTPHVLRVIDLANQAEKGVNVDWYLRGAVTGTLNEFREQYNGATLTAAYIEALESAAAQAEPKRAVYIRTLQTAVGAARNPR
ncbi:hypothetical protein DWG18_07740 [Lysobacter sp. TY2-98]|uniref:hypothetical protein n=1 Tax=Lysobacter sp. TY2-98 TaxID=2290922 RepID=UPI000E205602|nr:hypothetical protein [Lysobacter sp. TY2-98]AXK72184.1 hypothetical protein DWG18_07740 [Lysobacter sp. TY2-98]